MTDRPPTAMFVCGGYAIGDERLVSHRQVTIRSEDGPAPAVGDAFTIARDEGLHDLVVLAVLRSDAGWTAHCGVVAVA